MSYIINDDGADRTLVTHSKYITEVKAWIEAEKPDLALVLNDDGSIMRKEVYLGEVAFIKGYQNGVKIYEFARIDGKLQGLYLSWYENGNMMRAETYHNGELDGPFMTFDEHGDDANSGYYKDGKLVFEKRPLV